MVGQTGFVILGLTTSLGDNEFKPVKLHLKMDLLFHFSLAKWLVSTYMLLDLSVMPLAKQSFSIEISFRISKFLLGSSYQ